MSPPTPSAALSPTAPSLALFGFEPLRAAIEYASLLLTKSACERSGDGHPVVIFPGLGTDGRSVEPLSPKPERMTLIGWSLGGIYAREIAKLLDGQVRQVITIGTPFAGSPDCTNVGLFYRLLSGQRAVLDPAMAARFACAPPVPTTSIYSRSDGVVSWRACLQAGGGQVQNIEVDGSHCGLGWNRKVRAVIADRLALPDGSWKPYRPRRH